MVLLKIIRKIKQQEKDVRILMLGLDNAGKTTVVKKFCGDDINEIAPTLGFDIKTLEYQGFHLNIWDVGGQSSIRTYWKNYFEQTDAIIWVVDSSDTQRLEDCKRELQSLLLEERLAGATLLVLANKQDLAGALSCEEISRFLGLQAVESRHWRIDAVSATTGQGLLSAVEWLIRDVASRVFMSD